MALITLDEVSKEFVVRIRAGRIRRTTRTVTAVDRVSFAVEAGSMVGYIGPNGAGKSTTVKMLIGILVPSSGRVVVDGRDPSRERVEVTRRIGVVVGQRSQLWWDLPLADSFELLRHVYRVPAARHAEVLAGFVELLDLGPFLRTPVRQLSLGQRMRGELAAALLHEPPVVLLDEPTIGLDIASKDAVRRFLLELNRERGTTVLLTTHDLADVERLCRRLIVIDHGRVVEDTTVADIVRRHGDHRTLVVDLDDPVPDLIVPGAELVRVEGPRHWLRFSRADHTAASLLDAVARHHAVHDLSLEEPSIEEIVGRIYRGETDPGT
ncbi:MAG TPA: ATP-binding cassette domain-containing protein [Acidimicrobiales bacterium]|nr:ATP-binding cassette domain-containing protein [Acidimicrobiales bacterium]